MFFTRVWLKAKAKARLALQPPVVLERDLPYASLNTIKADPLTLWKVTMFGRKVKLITMGKSVTVQVYKGTPYLVAYDD